MDATVFWIVLFGLACFASGCWFGATLSDPFYGEERHTRRHFGLSNRGEG